VILSLQQQAERMLQDTPSICTPAQLAKVIGINYVTMNRQIVARRIPVMKTRGGHRRIPRATQIQIVAEALRSGSQG